MATKDKEKKVLTDQERLSEAKKIVRNNMYMAMGIGVVPYPLVDIAGIAAFQAKAIKELSSLYDVPFNDHKIKNILASLISGVTAPWLGGVLFSSVVKFLPGLGTFMGIVKVPIAAGAVTYAIGRVFVQHFEAGGTLLDFDPDKMRDFFSEQMKEGKKAAEDASKSAKKPAAAAAS